MTDYLTETEVLDRWPMLSRYTLRRARHRGQISHYAFSRRQGDPQCGLTH